MSKIGVEMRDFQAQPPAQAEAAPEGVEARSLYGAAAPPDRSGLITAIAILMLGVAAGAVGYLAISGLSWPG